VHAMVPSSWVEHRGGYTTENYDASGTPGYLKDLKRYRKKWHITRFQVFIHHMITKIARWVKSDLTR
jgi:hypothetical protein